MMKQKASYEVQYAGKRKRTRKECSLIEMDEVVPWRGLINLIEAHEPTAEGGCRAYQLKEPVTRC